MEPIKLVATVRTESGKGKIRRLRASGLVPAVAYGKNLPSTALSVSPKGLQDVFKSEYGRNSVIEIDIEGGNKVKALLCDFQRHPVTRDFLHVDFFQIHDDQLVDVDVPFEPTGRPKGVVLGGVLRQVYRKLPLRCLPKDIPVKITHDVTELELEGAVSVKELSLPAGVVVRLPPEQTVVAVVGEKKHEEEEAAAAAPGGAPGASGAAAAAPAEGAKAGAAKAEGKGGGKSEGKPTKS